jgi:hypothetical protein
MAGAAEGAPVVLLAQATGFLDGAIVHLLGLIRHGLMPYPGIPRPFKAYFTAVVILDAATMALLLARSRWSVPLGLATDLTANLIAQYRYWGGDAAAPGLLPLYGFGLLVFSSPAPCGGCCPVGPARQRGQTSRNFCPAAQAATTRAAPPSLGEPALVLPGSRCGRIDLASPLRCASVGPAPRAGPLLAASPVLPRSAAPSSIQPPSASPAWCPNPAGTPPPCWQCVSLGMPDQTARGAPRACRPEQVTASGCGPLGRAGQGARPGTLRGA